MLISNFENIFFNSIEDSKDIPLVVEQAPVAPAVDPLSAEKQYRCKACNGGRDRNKNGNPEPLIICGTCRTASKCQTFLYFYCNNFFKTKSESRHKNPFDFQVILLASISLWS